MSDTGVEHRVPPLLGQVIYRIPMSNGRGKPKGSNFDRIDEPLYAEMLVLLYKRRVANVTEAARAVATRAHNYKGTAASEESMIKRLRRGFFRWVVELKKLSASDPYAPIICLF